MADKEKEYSPYNASRLSVAPMMDWTDRHCRMFHRQFTQSAILYTEMITSAALVRGGAAYLLKYSEAEHPIALQLGGSDHAELGEAVRIANDFAYDEINLNVGCPSDRVQSGCFGAVLMERPELVAECVSAMIVASGGARITVKCRIGVDEQEPRETLPAFLAAVQAAGVNHVSIHARKAWLQGLSPKENRDVPPLDYPLVRDMKVAFPTMEIALNGGVNSLDEAEAHLASGLDGVMVGRAAYHHPSDLLGAADSRIFGNGPIVSAEDAVIAMLPYIEAELGDGTRLNQITRHMLGAFSGRPGGRQWRRTLSEGAHKPGAGPELVLEGLKAVKAHAA